MHEQDELNEAAAEAATGDVPRPLYPGDRGTLPLEVRRLLVQLLGGPSLDGRRHRLLWPTLVRHRALVEARLADLFLELVVDDDAEVAFVRQADTGELEPPILLRRTPLTFLDSALLLYLRQLLAEADMRGERAVVSSHDMLEQLKLYEGKLNTDHAGFEKRINSAIEKAKKNSLLSVIRGSDERYEISPTLKLLFGAEEVAQLIRVYQDARSGDAGAREDAGSGGEDAHDGESAEDLT